MRRIAQQSIVAMHTQTHTYIQTLYICYGYIFTHHLFNQLEIIINENKINSC